ncbi:unnamed protein product [Adineta ricciae]|uniref:G-protein coupled receptors family 1 profile domain-containing protein n=1 Tax=Adineta ricciae TaxID=249248 RepID=A0A814KRZ1_ADIRI|nr:unnamed protein product [Adineta ricciae]CAF1418753.1 unnamed protein product [Adineta ricciae]
MSLVYIVQQIMAYSGIFFLVFGMFGNTMSIYIFSSVPTYRRTPATFYFLIESIFKILFLIINLLPRVVVLVIGYDFTNTSSFWCKLRQGTLIVSATIAITLASLCMIDQYLITSSNASVRRLSQIKISHRVSFIITVICCLHAIPFYLYIEISPITKTCVPVNPGLAAYVPIYFLIILCGIPASILLIFGSLTYRNIRRTINLSERCADRQLLKMTVLQIILLVCCTGPLGVYYLYSLFTSEIIKDQDRITKEYLAYAMISTEQGFYYSSSFYIFLFSSRVFRRHVKQRLLRQRRTNSVVPNNQIQ